VDNVGVSLIDNDGDMGGHSACGLYMGLGSSLTALALASDGVLALGNGEGKFKDTDRRFRDLTEPDGDAFPLRDAGKIMASCPPSSAIANSTSVTSELSRLLTGTMVCVDCNDSAIDTGRDARLPTFDAPGRMVLKLSESLFRQTSFVCTLS